MAPRTRVFAVPVVLVLGAVALAAALTPCISIVAAGSDTPPAAPRLVAAGVVSTEANEFGPRAHAGRKDALLLPDRAGPHELPGHPRFAKAARRRLGRAGDRALLGRMERHRPLDLTGRPDARLRFDAARRQGRREEGLRPVGRRPHGGRLVGTATSRRSREQPPGRIDDLDRVGRHALPRFDALRRPWRPGPLYREARRRGVPGAGADHRSQHRPRRLERLRHAGSVAPRLRLEPFGRSCPGAVLGILGLPARAGRLERPGEALCLPSTGARPS